MFGKHLELAGKKFTGRFGLTLILSDAIGAKNTIPQLRWEIVAFIQNSQELKQVEALVALQDFMSTNAVAKPPTFIKFLTDAKVIVAVRHNFMALATYTQ